MMHGTYNIGLRIVRLGGEGMEYLQIINVTGRLQNMSLQPSYSKGPHSSLQAISGAAREKIT